MGSTKSTPYIAGANLRLVVKLHKIRKAMYNQSSIGCKIDSIYVEIIHIYKFMSHLPDTTFRRFLPSMTWSNPSASNLWNETLNVLIPNRSEHYATYKNSEEDVRLDSTIHVEDHNVTSEVTGEDTGDLIQDVIIRPKPRTPPIPTLLSYRPRYHSTSPTSGLLRQPPSRPPSRSPGVASDVSSGDSHTSSSILIQEDLKYIQQVTIEDTISFVPNLRYGKVLSIEDDGQTIVVASRIYNGYTTVLSPHTYRFSLVIDGIFVIDRAAAYTRLAQILIDNIVYVPYLYAHPESGNLHAQIYMNDIHVNQWMIDQGLATTGNEV